MGISGSPPNAHLTSPQSPLRIVLALALAQFAIVTSCNPYSAGKERTDLSAGRSELFQNMGSLHHPITTTNADAQGFFDQGLTFFYAFNFAEAVRSFRRASQLDSGAAMPYWGMALALGPNYNSPKVSDANEQAAYESIQKAKTLATAGPGSERAYVDSLAARFTNEPNIDSEKLSLVYAKAMEDLSRSHPEDPDAATLYAESLMDLHSKQLWTNDGKPGEDTPKILQVLEGVLARWPDHIGANHFYIHAMEASPFPERALPSARRLETLVPAAGHLIHMPAHIYARTGEYSEAVRSTLAAAAVDQEYLRGQSSDRAYIVGYSQHNLLFLTAVAAAEGNFEVANKVSKDLESQARAMLADTPMTETYMPAPLFVLLRFARWDDLLAVPEPTTSLRGLSFYWHYARGCAFAHKGQAKEARKERREMEEDYKNLPLGRAFGILPNDWTTIHDLALHSLDARIFASIGDSRGAIAQWRAAVATEDDMHYHEPADWYYPIRESLGASLLMNGKLGEAERVFRKDLALNPSNPRSLFGLCQTLKAEGNGPGSDNFRELFRLAWKGEESQLRIEDF